MQTNIFCDSAKSFACKLLQTQLITSKYKAKVYYCDLLTPIPFKWNDETKDGERIKVVPFYEKYGYILKSPLSDKEIEAIMTSTRIKKALNLMTDYPVRVNNDTIMSINYCNIDDTQFEVKSSKLETNVAIYTGDKSIYNSSQITKCPLEVFKVLLFRKIIGTNDTVDRNFLCADEIFLSIDDPAYFRETEYMFKTPLAKKYRDDYFRCFDQCWEELTQIINEWRTLINAIEFECDKKFMLRQLAKHSEKEGWKWI